VRSNGAVVLSIRCSFFSRFDFVAVYSSSNALSSFCFSPRDVGVSSEARTAKYRCNPLAVKNVCALTFVQCVLSFAVDLYP
jgi:hypothetical protein